MKVIIHDIYHLSGVLSLVLMLVVVAFKDLRALPIHFSFDCWFRCHLGFTAVVIGEVNTLPRHLRPFVGLLIIGSAFL